MVTKRILLFGGNGQIGRALQHQQLPADWHLGVCTRATCDFTRPGDINKALRDFAPALVINAAALTDVDACEKNHGLAMEVNFHAVANIIAQCVALDAPLIQISTDYVFDGRDGDQPYLPDSKMNPVNVYGHSKMMGEEAARHGSYWHVILRTSLVFGAFGENVLTKMLRQIDTQDEIKMVGDQIANPTSALSVAQGLIKISDAILDGKANGFGTFHLCDAPAVTRLEFAQAVIDAYAPFTTRHPRLVSVASADMPGGAPRPPYSALNCDKTRTVFGIKPRMWRDELAAAVKQIMKERSV